MRVLIIIPAYNEEDNIVQVIKSLASVPKECDYVIVNDGSKDNTAKICYDNNYNILDLPVNLGLTGAFQTGMKYAYLHGYDAAVQIDGDGQHKPHFLQDLIEHMKKTDSDIVVGSRFLTEKKPKSLRMLGNNFLQLLIRITTKKNINDPTSGMRLYNKNIIKQFAKNVNFAPEPDTIAYLIQSGIKLSEVQVYMDDRTAGVSYLNPLKSIEYMINMTISILLIQWFRRES